MSRKSILDLIVANRAQRIPPIAKVGDREIFPISGAEEDDGGTDDAEEEGDDADESPSTDDSEDNDDKKPSKSKNPELDRAVKQAIQRKQALREKEAELEQANARLRELENKDKSELEKLQSDYQVLEKDRDSWKTKYEELLSVGATKTMELEALKVSPKLKIEWRDLEDVLTWLGKQDSVTVEEDGTVTGVESALKTLAKAKPHWVKEGTSSNGARSTGSPTGGNVGGGRNGSGNANRSKLEAKYPGIVRNRT